MSTETFDSADRSNPQAHPSADADTLAMLASLRLAVSNALNRKRRLGHYVVQWSTGAPVLTGDDAPNVIAHDR